MAEALHFDAVASTEFLRIRLQTVTAMTEIFAFCVNTYGINHPWYIFRRPRDNRRLQLPGTQLLLTEFVWRLSVLRGW